LGKFILFFVWGLNIRRFFTEEKLEKQREAPPSLKTFLLSTYSAFTSLTGYFEKNHVKLLYQSK